MKEKLTNLNWIIEKSVIIATHFCILVSVINGITKEKNEWIKEHLNTINLFHLMTYNTCITTMDYTLFFNVHRSFYKEELRVWLGINFENFQHRWRFH
jgi:uncharacterized protein (UPF0303 family)